MAEEKKTAPSGDGKDSNKMMMIMQLVFAVVNLGVVGGGAFLVYASTLGWHAPSITEKSLRNPASKKNAGHGKEAEGGGHGAPAPEAAGGHGAEEPEVVLFTQKLDKFTVNLDGEPRRTIRLEINLEMLMKNLTKSPWTPPRCPRFAIASWRF